MTKSITSLSHSVKHNSNIKAYFSKFQKTTRHTWKFLAAHRLRTTGYSPLGVIME